MYYRQALDLQCFLEYAEDKGMHLFVDPFYISGIFNAMSFFWSWLEWFVMSAIFSGYRTIEKSEAHKKIFDYSQALTDLKFTYVVSCQVYGSQKKSSDARDRSCANNILNLMLKWVAHKWNVFWWVKDAIDVLVI